MGFVAYQQSGNHKSHSHTVKTTVNINVADMKIHWADETLTVLQLHTGR